MPRTTLSTLQLSFLARKLAKNAAISTNSKRNDSNDKKSATTLRSWVSAITASSAITAILCLSGCDYTTSIDVPNHVVITPSTFNSAPGYQLPYAIFAPNSLQGWDKMLQSQMTYDESTHTYTLDGIPLLAPVNDGFGPRFKICGENWSNQFGFSDHVPAEETTFGVTTSGTILSIQKMPFATSDMHMEFSEQAIEEARHKLVKIELKVIEASKYPKAYIRVTVY